MVGGFGGVGARALLDLRSLRAQGFHAGETEAERSCGLHQVIQQDRGTGLDPCLPFLLLPSSWDSGAGFPACAAHHAS